MDFMHLMFALVGLTGGFGLGWLALSARLAHARGYAAGLQDERDQLTDALNAARNENIEYRERAATLEAKREALEQQMREQQERLKTEFKNTANTIFEEISTKFTTQSEKKIGDLLNPMRERLVEFQKLVSDSFGQQGKEQHTLKSEIEKIVLQTDSLTKALRGDAKAQGNWGEVMLERILEESGLRRDLDYVIQAAEMKLTAEDGSRQLPDVIVRLPDSKHIIIDAKVSLTAYDRYCAAIDDAERAMQLKEFLRSVKSHVSGLEQKRYQHNEKLAAPDMVLMFMPTEGAFSFAIQNDTELHGYAWGRKIVIVSPTTLFATLRTIASIWKVEQQNRYALQIADEGGKMYDKLVAFVEDLQSVGRQMDKLSQTYDGAMNKLKSGTGNLITRAEKMKQLGAKATKSLPADMAEDNDKVVLLSTAEES